MTFTRKSADVTEIKEAVFDAVRDATNAKQQYRTEAVIDATIGSLYGEDEALTAFDSVFDHYDSISHRLKAKYGSFAGNKNYLDAVYDWVFDGVPLNLSHRIVATPGGTGAVFSSIFVFLEEGDTLIIPDIAWGNYKRMASQNNLKICQYQLFEEDHFNFASLQEKINLVQQSQDRVVIVINDPCHNPTGYSMSDEEWETLIQIVNEASKKTPIIVLNDIAYFDFAYDNGRNYMKHFNDISDNVMLMIAFSCSKTLTSYGLRCGAAIALAKKEEDVIDVFNVLAKDARATWSNIPNAAMENFVWVTKENREAFLKEKQSYIDLMKTRSDLFLKEAQEVSLPLYPFKEGFFVTLKIEDPAQIATLQEAFKKELIFTVPVAKGIRIAICSLPIKKIHGLAKKLKDIMEEAL